MKRINQKEFRNYMGAVAVFTEAASREAEIDYVFGYRYGLRCCYHGDDFGSDAIIAAMILRGGASKDGFNDGLLGKPVDWSRLTEVGPRNPLSLTQRSIDEVH
jgi:hypothetical protein